MSVYYKENPVFLRTAISCMLKQTVKPAEFVIIEDGPLTAELDTVISEFEKNHPKLFKIIKLKKNQGLGLSLRRGITECSHELIARMDSDDYCEPDRIEKQLSFLTKHPGYDIVGTNVEEFIDEPGNVISHVILPKTNDEIKKFIKVRCPFRHPSLLYKKSAILSIGNYRHMYMFEDYDLYARAIANGLKCYNLQEPLTYMRISEDFYKRRGGIKYAKAMVDFKKGLLRSGFLTRFEYLKTTAPHVIVCLMPNSMRNFIYRKFLRKAA